MAKKKLVFANNPLLSGPALNERERSGVPYREIELSSIESDPNQPRLTFHEDKLRELASSIKTYGVLSPILVRPTGGPGRYRIISGERRYRASQLAGKSTIPCLVDQSSDASNERTLAMQLVENIQRDDLNPLERSHAIGALKDTYNLSVREVGERLGVSKSMVQRSLEILELPDDLLNALRNGASESKVLLLAKIEDEEIRASYLKDLDLLTRSQLQKEIETDRNNEVKHSENLQPEDARIIDEIRKALGLKVKMTRSATNTSAGKLLIDFYSDEDLQELFRKLVAED
jgi:ParB family chromosome partitioning protein